MQLGTLLGRSQLGKAGERVHGGCHAVGSWSQNWSSWGLLRQVTRSAVP